MTASSLWANLKQQRCRTYHRLFGSCGCTFINRKCEQIKSVWDIRKIFATSLKSFVCLLVAGGFLHLGITILLYILFVYYSLKLFILVFKLCLSKVLFLILIKLSLRPFVCLYFQCVLQCSHFFPLCVVCTISTLCSTMYYCAHKIQEYISHESIGSVRKMPQKISLDLKSFWKCGNTILHG